MASFYLGKMEFSERRFKKATQHLLDVVDRLGDGTDQTRKVALAAHALLVQAYEHRNMSDEATRHCRAVGRGSMFDPNQDYEPLFRIAPAYPSGLLKNGVQGHVDVSFTVDESGFVRNPVVIDEKRSRSNRGMSAPRPAGDNSFEAAALDAVKRFRYAPRYVEGDAVAVDDVKTRITFRISD